VSQGIVTAHAVFTTKDVEDAKAEGEPYIWIADETTPDDTPQMLDAAGILTTTGSSVSHAAVCAREWGLPCVVGFEDMDLSANPEGVISAVINNEWQLNAGDLITINGTTGEVMLHD
jgi:pyruvate,orthophosphate dikinase